MANEDNELEKKMAAILATHCIFLNKSREDVALVISDMITKHLKTRDVTYSEIEQLSKIFEGLVRTELARYEKEHISARDISILTIKIDELNALAQTYREKERATAADIVVLTGKIADVLGMLDKYKVTSGAESLGLRGDVNKIMTDRREEGVLLAAKEKEEAIRGKDYIYLSGFKKWALILVLLTGVIGFVWKLVDYLASHPFPGLGK